MRDCSERLARLVDRAGPVLRARSEEEVRAPRIAGGWSSKQILGHLIDSAANNHQRFVRAALEGSLVWPGYDQNGCVRIEAFQQAPWPLLVETWASLNRLLAHVLAHLPAASAEAPCRIGSDNAITLAALAESYIAHLEHHLDQLSA
jgi:hypothetical protein